VVNFYNFFDIVLLSYNPSNFPQAILPSAAGQRVKEWFSVGIFGLVGDRAGHSLFLPGLLSAVHPIFTHGSLSLYRSFCRFSGALIALKKTSGSLSLARGKQ